MSGQKLRRFSWSKASNQPKELEKVFKRMWLYYDLYSQLAGDDVPYWYTEMSQVGNLAIAAGCLDYAATLEFDPGTERRKKWGRADLWLGFTKEKHLIIEAKKDDFALDPRPEAIRDNIKYYMKGTLKQLNGYTSVKDSGYDKSWKCGLIFNLIYLPKSQREKYKVKREQLISNWEKEVNNPERDISFLAYYFERALTDKLLYKNYYYPGIIIWGKIWPPKKGWGQRKY
jgi:hypothetical protein